MITLHCTAMINDRMMNKEIIKQHTRARAMTLLTSKIKPNRKYTIKLTESIRQAQFIYDPDVQEYRCSIELEEQ